MGTIGTAVRHRASRAGAILLLVAAWSQVHAMTNAEVCALRAGFVESAAHMRDAGKSEAQVLKETKAAYKKQLRRDPPASLNDYVKAVFTGRQYKPSELGVMVEYLCLKELQ